MPPTSPVIIWSVPFNILTPNKEVECPCKIPICFPTTRSQIIIKCYTPQDNNQFFSSIQSRATIPFL